MGSWIRRAALVLTIVAGPLLAATPASADDGPRPSPSPTPPPVILGFTPEQYAQATAIAQATTLGVRIEAERALAAAEQRFVRARQAEVQAQRDALLPRIDALAAEVARRQADLDRIVQREYRESQRTPLEVLLQTGSIVSAIVATDALGTLAGAHRDALAQVERAQAELSAQRAALADREAELAGYADALAAKDRALARFADAAARLARGGSAAEVAVLADLVQAEIDASAAVDRLVAAAAAAAGTPLAAPLRWVRPVSGPVSQPFGPSALALEPPRTYHGIRYPSFHDGLDLAAPLGAPVLAAADGIVAFVGHLPDGAMVVLVAHAGGLVSLYAHLDDTLAPPPVRTGQPVRAGERIGTVGLTGLTTGPHLHFVIRRGDEPIDPAGLLPAS